ncbi:MAG: rRNA adenine dimethyltransferase family protein [Patescibacteria group bacterium]
MTISEIKLLCRQCNIVPNKSHGQNFLIDENIVKKIIEAAEIEKDEIILEVGPGLGILTSELVKCAGRVVAVELDKNIFGFLQAEFFLDPSLALPLNKGEGRRAVRPPPCFKEGVRGWSKIKIPPPFRHPSLKQGGGKTYYALKQGEGKTVKNLEIIQGDILKLNPGDFGLKDFKYKVVANLPYSITSFFLRRFLEQAPRPSEMILMVQKEVAERVVAQPGKMSVLSVAAQFFSQPKILFKVSRSCFWPEPEVDSAVISLKLAKKLPFDDSKEFFRIVKIGFSSRRKQLQNNLAAGLKVKNEEIKEILRGLGFDQKVRAQELRVEDWVKLVEKIQNIKIFSSSRGSERE